MADRIIEAAGPDGALFACVDPSARYCDSKPSALKFAARLTPYRDEAAAVAALEAAGATLIGGKHNG